MMHGRAETQDARVERLRSALEAAAELLPSQGPLTAFVHHNPLHAFEHLPFEQAVVEAAPVFGAEPYLDEDGYRAELRAGRIRDEDLVAVVEAAHRGAAEASIAGLASRADLCLLLLRYGVPERSGPALRWALAETDALRAFRADLDEATRARLLAPMEVGGRLRRREAGAVEALWRASLDAAGRVVPSGEAEACGGRHRDLLLRATGVDTDEPVHAFLIRFCAAYLDQGMAYWEMPDREFGMYRAFLRLYGRRGGFEDGWWRGLGAAVRDLLARDIGAEGCAIEALDALGVAPEEWEAYVQLGLSALRGWAGMIRQTELRPERLPARPLPATLADFLAVRLLLDRLAVSALSRGRLGCEPLLGSLRAAGTSPARPPAERIEADAWVLFQAAQLLGCGAETVRALSSDATAALLAEVEAHSGMALRRLFQRAYERAFRVGLFDAVAAHRPARRLDAPRFQAVFCIDEREESLRRHLEAAAPGCATYGTTGHFGIPMLYRGAVDAHARPLCPDSVRPGHLIEERAFPGSDAAHARWRRVRRWVGGTAHGLHIGSRTLVRGAMLTAAFGLAAAVPLVARVLFPLRTARLRASAGRANRPPERTMLRLFREDDNRVDGMWHGFRPVEMAEIVGQVLVEMGLVDGFSELVLIVGHGSSSLNNPHEAAHDCGACGGGRGGPNARVFAEMANAEQVRTLLGERGIAIPGATRFVAAYHNTCDDSNVYFDAEDLRAAPGNAWAEAQQAMTTALAGNAHERCRRFESADLALSPREALRHVAERAEDLAQPRPEYGHATNAVCFVGRRERTAGLFLDRRAFLVSYDPGRDGESGDCLASILRAILPVCSGISLEYYFSYVDPVGYGCGTKLPHNITSLLGVMDGHASDLRTGLPWQMVEVHEPVRLVLIVEAPRERILRVIEREPGVARLVRNEWVCLAALDPDGDALHTWVEGAFIAHPPAARRPPTAANSMAWYAGRRGPLPWALLEPVGAGRSAVPGGMAS
jgi:hypothetical protein